MDRFQEPHTNSPSREDLRRERLTDQIEAARHRLDTARQLIGALADRLEDQRDTQALDDINSLTADLEAAMLRVRVPMLFGRVA